MTQAKGDWVQFAATLSGMPDLVERLLAIHRDDGTGHCRGCTTPGRGTPSAVWPCGITVVAELAAGLPRRPPEDGPDRPTARRTPPAAGGAIGPTSGNADRAKLPFPAADAGADDRAQHRGPSDRVSAQPADQGRTAHSGFAAGRAALADRLRR